MRPKNSPETTVRPLGLIPQAMKYSSAEKHATRSPVSMSQTFKVWSEEAETAWRPAVNVGAE